MISNSLDQRTLTRYCNFNFITKSTTYLYLCERRMEIDKFWPTAKVKYKSDWIPLWIVGRKRIEHEGILWWMALSFKRCRQCRVEQELRMFSRQMTETFRTAPTAPKVSCNCHQLEGKDVAALQVFHLTTNLHTHRQIEKNWKFWLQSIFRQVSHYRFFISWPKSLPDGIGQLNSKATDWTRRLIKTLAANIQPKWFVRKNEKSLSTWNIQFSFFQ